MNQDLVATPSFRILFSEPETTRSSPEELGHADGLIADRADLLVSLDDRHAAQSERHRGA